MHNLSLKNETDLDQLNAREYIVVKRARTNNLKSLSVAIPRNKLVVITGLSGSGKSSLAFDTLFAEGQRMYVESLSAYARQFLGRVEKPAVDYIRGVAPAIAIEQKNHTKHPRSTVGTSTEIYDYLKLLYARVGITYSPVSGQQVTKDSVADVVDYIQKHPPGTKVMILAPLKVLQGRSWVNTLKIELGKGFTRIMQGKALLFIEDLLADPARLHAQEDNYLLVDRIVVNAVHEQHQVRIADSVQTAFFEGEGVCAIEVIGATRRTFSDRFERDGMTFEVPSVNFFSFNNPYGACTTCAGFGKILGIDEDKVIPDKRLTIAEGAIVPWQSKFMQKWLDPLLKQYQTFAFPIHAPYAALSTEQKKLLWTGKKDFQGLHAFFEYLAKNSHKIQCRVLLSRYRGKTDCPDCQGTRIRPDAVYVKVGGRSITELLLMSVDQLMRFFDHLTLDVHQRPVAERILQEIGNRLQYLVQVGLGYLTLNRQVATLSGGECQRIKLATALGSTLVGTMYVLDEPTVGLHPRDTRKLTDILLTLKQLGNTVIVVEHEEMVMRAADQLIDIGPEAGSRGGELVFQGDWNALKGETKSYTARYLTGLDAIPVPSQRKTWQYKLRVRGAYEHNLKHIDVDIPLGILTIVTGVSGSGKSTLVTEILYPAIRKSLGMQAERVGKLDTLSGDLQKINHVDFVDQHPIGKSSRSNPSTYLKAYDAIRQLFAAQPLARQRGYQPGQFSFNTTGGRCEACQGEGVVKIEMQFMSDIILSCESCRGKRFKAETLEIKYKEKNVAEVLSMTVEDSLQFFADQPVVCNKLLPLQTVGLGYLQLGQSASVLSGGEAQRIKLAAYLGKGQQHQHTLFIFDEPTTGLHVHDIRKLLEAINVLIEQGNSVLVIEHNMEVIKCADWIIDLGPEGGEGGGEVVFSGTPETMVQLKNNYTARYLREKLR
mmetsp:Transcript_1036/g.2574  ORF Transcript_1036/g.2574 Transcript_1036/m.2574 type:complete len:939 (+) Transcript_1036:239-3055(+)